MVITKVVYVYAYILKSNLKSIMYISTWINSFFWYFVLFSTSLHMDQSGFKLAMQSKVTFSFWLSCLYLKRL